MLVKERILSIIEENGGREVEFCEFLGEMKSEYPELRFKSGKKFAFRPERTVVFPEDILKGSESGVRKSGDENLKNAILTAGAECGEKENNFLKLQLLHEIGHALSGHRTFATDLERLKMEREAWEKARGLCDKYKKYEVEYDEELVEAEMDTYREWLHQRSVCRRCGLTRYQTEWGEYFCPWCDQGSDLEKKCWSTIDVIPLHRKKMVDAL